MRYETVQLDLENPGETPLIMVHPFYRGDRHYTLLDGDGNYLDNVRTLVRSHRGIQIVFEADSKLERTKRFLAELNGDARREFIETIESHPEPRKMSWDGALELVLLHGTVFHGVGGYVGPDYHGCLGYTYELLTSRYATVKLVSGCCFR